MKNLKIQILRSIAIIAVVMIHTCIPGEAQVFIRPFINIGVATFIFLSGYLTNLDITDYFKFCKKRIIRVLIPYTIWSILYTSIFTISHNGGIQELVVNIIKNLLTSHAAAPFYFIFVYIQFVVFTPIMGKLLKSKFSWIGWTITPIYLVFKSSLTILGISLNSYIELAMSLSFLGWFIYYYLGLYLKNEYSKKIISIKYLTFLYGISIILQMLEGYLLFTHGDMNCGTQLKLTAMITNIIVILMEYLYINYKKYNGNNKLLVLIGDYSFGIFFIHCLIILLFQKYISFYNQIPFCLNSIIVLMFSFIIVLIMNKIVGKRISKIFGII